MEGLDIPDVAGSVLGWRSWKVEGNVLISLNGVEWPHRQALQADCLHSNGKHRDTDGRIPHTHCTCGIYMKTGLTEGDAIARSNFLQHDGVTGELHAWGKIIPGTTGLRAEHAYPKRLLVPTTMWKVAISLRDAYGVPVKLFNPYDITEEEVDGHWN